MQKHREHEGEQPDTVVFRRGFREEVVHDGLVLVFELPSGTVPVTEGFGLVRADVQIRREHGRAIRLRRRDVQ